MGKPRVIGITGAILAALAVAGPATAAPFRSANVRLVTKLPTAIGAISARFEGHHMYVSSVTGLQIFDISDPERPRLRSILPLPHFENEDIDVQNGIAIISNDPSETIGLIYVIDVKNPRKPFIRSVLPNGWTGGEDLGGLFAGAGAGKSYTGHIANCLRGCQYLWMTGTDEGVVVIDLRNPDKPRYLTEFELPIPKQRGDETDPKELEPGFTHDVFVDRAGIAWVTGEDGTFGYDVTKSVKRPKLVYRSDENVTNTGQSGPGPGGNTPLDFLHHNSIRTSIEYGKSVKKAAKPRAKGSTTLGGTGDILGVTEEDYTRPTCAGQGSFQTWQITWNKRNSDRTRKLRLLDSWTTELNEFRNLTGRSPVTALCSAHWFDEDRGLIAQGWYDQGVRFLDIRNPRDIEQVGYWVTAGTFWAAYFAPTDPTRQTVYALDVAGGVDVLHIAREPDGAAKPVTAPVSMPGSRRTVVRPSANFGFACPLPATSLMQLVRRG